MQQINEEYNQFNFEDQYFDILDQDADMNIAKIIQRSANSAFQPASNSFHRVRKLQQLDTKLDNKDEDVFKANLSFFQEEESSKKQTDSLVKLNLFPSKQILQALQFQSDELNCFMAEEDNQTAQETQPSSTHPSPILEDNIIQEEELDIEALMTPLGDLNQAVEELFMKPSSDEDSKDIKRRQRKDKTQLL
jgi:hypothetical protein